MRLRSLLLPGLILLRFLFSAEAKTLFEFSIDERSIRSHGGGFEVGTCMYAPTETEKPFYDRLSEDNRVTLNSKADSEQKKTFSLQGHDGKYVSWSGIVRRITPAKDGAAAQLLIENKYFDDFTDCHIQTVAIGGAGDFIVTLDAIPKDVIPLMLVRVYGVVTGHEDAHPVITPEYVRVWRWLQFNFTDAIGEDHGNPEWKKRMHLPDGERVYHMGVSPRYYYERLGPTEDEWEQYGVYDQAHTWLELSREPYEAGEGTAVYTPTQDEEQFFNRLAVADRLTVESTAQETEHAKFQLRGHVDQFVSWFGIIREATPYISKPGGALLIENKYFKGSGDQSLQTVSLRGGGDFKGDLSSFSKDLAPLSLVRIYGKVVREEGDVAVVQASFVRIWDVGQYNFDDYGVDRSKSAWTKKRQLKSDERAYASKMSADYYIRRLSPTEEQAQKIKVLFMSDEERQKYYQERDKAKGSPTPSR
jgi:hypothetical protein